MFIEGVISGLTFVVIVPFVAFFFLKEGRRLTRCLMAFVPNAYFELCLNLMHQANKQIGNYIRGQLLAVIVVSVLSISGLSIIGVYYALPLGFARWVGQRDSVSRAIDRDSLLFDCGFGYWRWLGDGRQSDRYVLDRSTDRQRTHSTHSGGQKRRAAPVGRSLCRHGGEPISGHRRDVDRRTAHRCIVKVSGQTIYEGVRQYRLR